MRHKLTICFALLPLLLMAQHKTDQQYGFHTFLGVDVDNTSETTDGLNVNGVYRGYGAEKAGIKRGDILMSINSTHVHSFGELVNTLDKYKGGDNVTVSVIRNNSPQKINVKLSDYPEFLRYNSMIWIKDNGNEAEIQRAKLGIDVAPDWEKYAVVVTEFTDNSSAETAGVEKGDVILKMDGYQFATIEELKYYLSKYQPGDTVTLSIERNGQKLSMPVKLGTETLHFEKKSKEKEKS